MASNRGICYNMDKENDTDVSFQMYFREISAIMAGFQR